MDSMIYKGRKTKVKAVPYDSRRLSAWIIMLMFCLCLFCSDAGALPVPYDINEVGASNVYGISSGGNLDLPESGYYFGSVRATATTGSNAYSLYSSGGDITIVGLFGSSGLISATAGTSAAYGLYSDGSITTGDINGVISATAGTYSAYGLYSENGPIDVCDIDGIISATAGTSNAYGLYTDGGPITTGAIDGTITADANGSYAYALYADSDLTIDGDIGINANISATAGQDTAYALLGGSITTGAINGTITAEANNNAFGLRSSSGGGSITTGDINGTITADANGANAYALSSASGITTGDIGSSANISATAWYDEAAGLASQGDVNTGGIDGDITAEATTGSYAYGLYSSGGSIYTGDIGGTISATTGDWRAVGLFTDDGDINTGDISGSIIATSGGSSAFGLRCDYEEDTISTGDISGTITATAGGDRAYGFRSDGSIVTGAISGAINATAEGDYAAGLYSRGENSLTTGAISGTIDANAGGDFAYGILSYGPMDVTVTGGTISAVANDGNNVAAIQSGRTSGGALETQDANDTVGITAGSVIVGDINLAQYGSDYDVMALSAGVDADSNTTFDDDIMNIERIYITGGTWYLDGTVSDNNNGITIYGGILKGTGTLEDLYVGAGTLAPGSSIGVMHVGNLTFSPYSTFEVEVDDSNNADLVIASGWAELNNATINCEVLGDERIDHSFSATVIDANTGLYPSFAEPVTSSMIFPIYDVEYDTNNYDVILNVTVDYAYYADTDNQHSVGEAFNCIVFNDMDTGDMNDVLTAIEHLPDGDAANEAYNQLMPQDMLGLPDVTRQIMNQHNDSITSRMNDLRRNRQYSMLKNNRYLLASADNTYAFLSQTETDKWMPFAKGIGIWGGRDEASDVAGYEYSVYGAVAGMDMLVSDNSLLGFGIGLARTKVDYSQAGTDADIDSLLFSLHGSFFAEDSWHVDWTAAYGHNSYDLQRKINFDSIDRTATSDHKGSAYSAAIEFCKDFGYDSMILEQIAGMGYTYVKEKGYTESGADSLNLKVDSETSDGFYSKLGVRVAKEIRPEDNPNMVMVPKVSAFWIHDFTDRVEIDSSFVDGCGFTTKGLDPVRNMFNVGVGLNVYFSNNLRVFADYIWQSASDLDSRTAQAGVQWSF